MPVDIRSGRVLLLLGSNVDAEHQLDAALNCLRAQFGVCELSRRHLSPDSGRADAPAYLNQAAIIVSSLDRSTLKTVLRGIEAMLGRQRPSPDARLCRIDIDAVARVAPEFEVCDAESYDASYAMQPLLELGIR